MSVAPDRLISSILKHDSKQNTYKIALIRSINDVVLSFPDMLAVGKDVAIPLHLLARHWIAYYWAFVDENTPIYQSKRPSDGRGGYKNDISFRPQLTELRSTWQKINRVDSPADGYWLTNELHTPRKQQHYKRVAPELLRSYLKTVNAIIKAIEYPTRHAGTHLSGEYSVFKPYNMLANFDNVIGIPGTRTDDRCIVIPQDMWTAFQNLSLWIEALSIHQWALFINDVQQLTRSQVNAGQVFQLLISRPDNRVPLDWERNRFIAVMGQNVRFQCPWSKAIISVDSAFEVDHLIPVSVYPFNEIWNLVPTLPDANNWKRDKIPSKRLLDEARPILQRTYQTYHDHDGELKEALVVESHARFSTLGDSASQLPFDLSHNVIDFMDYTAQIRNLGRVEAF